jgi:hypothetical protein
MLLGLLGGLVCSTSGTLGILVRNPGTANVFLLGCSHVLAKSGKFGIPFALVPASQLLVQQPIPAPCDPTANGVGSLQAGYSEILAKDDGVNRADFALAALDPAVAAVTSSIQAATGNAITDFAREHPSEFQNGMRTRLLGAISAGVFGEIDRFEDEATETVTYPGIGDVLFSGVVRYNTNCQEGDSGAPVVDDQNRLLGMHIAGDSTRGVGLFLPLGDYLTSNNLVLF